MSIRDVGVQRGDINGDNQDINQKRSGERTEDSEEIIQNFNVRL